MGRKVGKEMKLFTILSLVFVLLVALPLEAQVAGSQDGSTAIAKEITVSSETMVADSVQCVTKLVEAQIPAKNAMEFCKEAVKIASKTATRVANEAADATKASRPMVVAPYGGYRYGGYYRGSVTVRSPRYRSPRYHTPRYSRPAPLPPPPVVAPQPVVPPPAN